MEVLNSRRMMNIGVMTALYFLLTMICRPLTFMQAEFRVSEILLLLCMFNPDYILSVTLGCFMANMYSHLPMDLLLGTLGTLVGAVVIYFWRDKNIFLLSLAPVLSNAALVGVVLKISGEKSFGYYAAHAALGEFVCVSVAGVAVVSLLRRKKGFISLVTSGMEKETDDEEEE